MYFPQINMIAGVHFTQREVEVISCILNTKGAKKIAYMLRISPRTVEGHIHNILLKLSCNSQESIKDFVEKSEYIVQLNQHYSDLSFINFLRQKLTVSAKLLKRDNIVCVINYQKSDMADFVVMGLEAAGINVILNQDCSSATAIMLFNGNENEIKKYRGHNLIIVDSDSNRNTISTDHNLINHVDKENIHEVIFKILEILSPEINYATALAECNDFIRNTLYLGNPRDKNTQVSPINITPQATDTKSHFFKKRASFIGYIFVMLLIYFFLESNSRLSEPEMSLPYRAISNFSLPDKAVLLERPHLLTKIEKALEGNEKIKTVVLVGAAGSGKTTLAHQYVIMQKQTPSVLWEINAETKDDLISSMEQLLYALSDSDSHREALNGLALSATSEQRGKQIVLLLEQELRHHPNWMLIYDNAKSFQFIQQYFPCNTKAWGRGRVIITTKNINITSHGSIKADNVMEVEALSEEEKYTLFSKIAQSNPANKTLLSNKMALKEFLKEVPPFPLDISMAAYHLKETQVQFDQYLEKISSPSVEFSAIQENILQSTGDYSKTRYGIISLYVEQLIAINPHFKELLFFTSLLDSQEIPRRLLRLYAKNDIIARDFIRELKKRSLILDHFPSGANDDYPVIFSMQPSIQRIILAYLNKSVNPHDKREILKRIPGALESYISKESKAGHAIRLRVLQHNCEAILSHRNIDKETEASIQIMLGSTLHHFGDDRKAKEILESALSSISPHNNSTDLEAAALLSCLGDVHRILGNYNTAAEHLKQGIAIYSRTKSNNAKVASALMNLANTYRSMGNFRQAKILLQNSISGHKEYQVNYIELAKTLWRLIMVYGEDR